MASVTWNPERFKAKVLEGCNRGLGAAAALLANRMRSGMSRGSRYSSSAPGTPPNVQRGWLWRNIVSTPGVNLRASAGATRNVPYAMIQERGGVIRPKRTRYLPVPVNPPAKRISELGGPRTVATRFIPRKGRDPLMIGDDARRVTFRAGGRNRSMSGRPVWVLKRAVRLPPRPWAVPALNRSRAEMVSVFSRTASRTIGRAIGATIQ